MSTAAIEVAMPENAPVVVPGLSSPPDSNNASKHDDGSDSELSEIDEPEAEPTAEAEPEPQQEPEDDIGEVVPFEISDGVPIFKPTMEQFKDFQKYVGVFLWPPPQP